MSVHFQVMFEQMAFDRLLMGGNKFANNLRDVGLYKSSFMCGYFYRVFKQG